ncbi:MAG: ABC transporter permease [Rhodobacteraceae bacterium]|nr:ABC transporter permease [Paracoccaceae bacterium]
MRINLFKRDNVLVWALLVLVLFFSFISPDFRRLDNLFEILRSCSLIALMILGVTWLVASGEIDVSFPNIAAFASIVTAYCIKIGIPWGATVVIAPISAIPLGLLSAFLINTFRFPALIATIAVASVATSLASMVNGGQPLYLAHSSDVVEYFVYGKIGGLVPVLFLLVLALFFFAKWIQDNTTVGQHLYALGENRKASLEAGINEKRIILSIFVLSALLAGISGVLLAASFSSGQPRIGGSFFIDGLTAVFLGSLMVKFGKPNVMGSLIGAIIIATLSNGITILGIPFYVGTITKGLLMAFCVGITMLNRKNKAPQLPT